MEARVLSWDITASNARVLKDLLDQHVHKVKHIECSSALANTIWEPNYPPASLRLIYLMVLIFIHLSFINLFIYLIR